MSRAFVDDDAGRDETEGMHDIPLPLPAGARNYMTPEGAAVMVAELNMLVDSERPKAAAALAAAGPADSADALRRLSEIDRRVSYLARMKAALEVVNLPASAERVVFGLEARVRNEGGAGAATAGATAEDADAEAVYRIVGADESDPSRGLLSWASPVAKALIGKKAGELALVRLPHGERRLRVLEVRFPAVGG